MRGFLFLGILLLSFTLFAQEQETNDLFENLRIQNELFDKLIQHNILEEELQQIKTYPENYIPPVLFALSQYYSSKSQKDQGWFYFLLAESRAQMDLAESDVLKEYRENILNQYRFFFGISFQKDLADYPELAEQIRLKAKEEAATISRKYSPLWLYFDGAETLQNLSDLKKVLTAWNQNSNLEYP